MALTWASGPALLRKLRDALLEQLLRLQEVDPAVEGVALVGSLGAGEADNWGDIDLLILMVDQALALSYVPVAGKYIGRRSPGPLTSAVRPSGSAGEPWASLPWILADR